MLEDLRKQFNSKPRTQEEKKQYQEEVQRVKATSQVDSNDQIAVIGDHLGKFFDALDAIEKLFWEEERKSHEVYKGDESLARRALQRVLIRSRLDAMQAEIREEMVYRTPAELKDLWTRFSNMREQIVAEQADARARELRVAQTARLHRARRIAFWKEQAAWLAAVTFVIAWYSVLLVLLRSSMTFRGYF